MQSSYADRTQVCWATSIGCSGEAPHQFTLPLALLCVFLFALCAQSVFAAVDIYVYKDENGALTFTSVPTHSGLTKIIRSENRLETKTGSSQATAKNTVVQLFHNKDTGDIGYLDRETFIPLWPESYITLTDDNTAFASPDEYEDIWVTGLSEQVGLIKMRQGLPLGVTVTAIDWLIEQNLDKYKPRITSQSNQLRTKFFIIAFVIVLASLLVIIVRNRYGNLATIPFFIRAAMVDDTLSNRRRLASLLVHCFKDHYNTLVTLSVLIRAAISKYALSHRCRDCKEHTENDTRICNECQIRLETEKANAREHERQEQENRTRRDDDSEREHTASENGFDPYQVLRITRGANQEEIKAAYFNLMKQYHPDRVSHLGQEFQKLAEEKAQLINRAYQLLVEKPGDIMIETR